MAIVSTDSRNYENIASAIREENGSETKYNPSEMPTAIREIKSAWIQDKKISSKTVLSSKNTIDRLTSPFVEKSPLVQGDLVGDYPMTVKTHFEPIQEGSGEPSPDNVRPIKGISGIMITRCGENFFQRKQLWLNPAWPLKGISVEVQTDGTWHITGTATARNVLYIYGEPVATFNSIPSKKSSQYTLQVKDPIPDGAKLTLASAKSNGSWAGEIVALTPGQTTKTGSATVDSPRMQVVFEVAQGTAIDYQLKVGLYKGAATSDMIRYSDVTFSADFGRSVYGGIFDWASGVLTVMWVGKTYNGATEEEWFVRQGQYIAIKNPDTGKSKDMQKGIANWTKFQYQYNGDNLLFDDTRDVGQLLIAGAALSQKYGVDVSSWKAQLSKTPLQVAFELRQPTNIQLTPQQVLSLQGINTLYSDYGETEVFARKDPIAEREALEKRVAALEAKATQI